MLSLSLQSDGYVSVPKESEESFDAKYTPVSHRQISLRQLCFVLILAATTGCFGFVLGRVTANHKLGPLGKTTD
jgi:hypothetical protein